MTITAQEAAYEVCRLSNWTINLDKLNALLYLLHLFYLDNKNEPLIDENFQAWTCGPMLKSLYLKLKCFHGRPIQNVFYKVNPYLITPEILFINDKYDDLIGLGYHNDFY